jgi:hypothetical protein
MSFLVRFLENKRFFSHLCTNDKFWAKFSIKVWILYVGGALRSKMLLSRFELSSYIIGQKYLLHYKVLYFTKICQFQQNWEILAQKMNFKITVIVKICILPAEILSKSPFRSLKCQWKTKPKLIFRTIKEYLLSHEITIFDDKKLLDLWVQNFGIKAHFFCLSLA